MKNVFIMDHPLIKHKIGLIRRKEIGTKEFRETIGEIAMLECYEATRNLELEDVEIETPICKTTVQEIKGKKLAVVPILRAGLGMVDGMLTMIPAAKVGHIGLYRDPETLAPVEYYCKLPADCAEREIFVVPEGIKAFTEAHPDVDLYIGAVDDHLNDHGYIVPGLGDAGDRIFGTK